MSWSGIANLNTADLDRAALVYVRAGFKPFPTFGIIPAPGGPGTGWNGGDWSCECGNTQCDRPGKHPRVKWSQVESSQEQVEEWWTRWPNSNIAIPTGHRSGYDAIDLDVKEVASNGHLAQVIDGAIEFEAMLERELGPGWDIKRLSTLTQRTGGGGTQLIIRDPGDVKTITSWLPGVDIRGYGGFILAPPSLHVSGRRYSWTETHPPAEDLPEKLISALRFARGHGSGGSAGGAGVEYDYAAAKQQGPPAGARDHFFNTYTFELRKLDWTRDAAEQELYRLWQLTPQPDSDPFLWETVAEKIQRVWSTVEPGDDRDPVDAELQDWARSQADRATAGLGQQPRAALARDEDTSGPPPGQGGGGNDLNVIPIRQPGNDREAATDLGNGERCERVWAGRAIFVPGIGWFLWDGRIWRRDGTRQIVTMVRDVLDDIRAQATRADGPDRDRWAQWAHQSESMSRITAMLTVAETRPGLVVTADQLDSHEHLLCCPNGVVDLRDGSLVPHDPTLLMTRMTGARYDPEARSELLDEFHRTFQPDDEVRDFIYRVIGSALWGKNRSRAWIIIIGGTTSGKGMWTSGVGAALGEYAVPVNSSVYRGTLDDRPRPDLIAALNARLVVAEEASSSWDLHTDQIKRMTGGDSIVVRGMHSNTMVRRVPDFTPIIVTNDMPHIKGADMAVKRRLIALPFVRSLPPAAEDITKKPAFVSDQETLEALLAALVAGAVAGYDPNSKPAAIEQMTAWTLEQVNNVAEFITHLREEGLLLEYVPETISADACVNTSTLHSIYVRWLREHGSREDQRSQLGPKQFSQQLVNMGWIRIRSNGTRWAGKVVTSDLSMGV